MDKRHAAYLHAETAALAAELRRDGEPERVRQLEIWRRQQDKPEREAASDIAGALINYIRACRFDPEVKPVLLAAMHAVHGEDQFVRVPDWLAGYYLAGGNEAEIEQLAPLPGRSREKRALAKQWRRAWDFLDAEQRRTGHVAVRRKHGNINRESGHKVCSEMHAVFVQHLVTIRKRALALRARRAERFERAAFEFVATLPCDPQSERRPETRPERIRQPETPALCLVRFLNKLEKMTDELLDAIPPQLRAEARAHAEAILEAKFAGGTLPEEEVEGAEADELPQLVNHDLKSGVQTAFEDTPAAPTSWGSAQGEICENPAKTCVPDQSCVPTDGYTTGHICPSPPVEPDIIRERVFIMCEAGDMTEAEAAEVARRDLCEACRVRVPESDHFEVRQRCPT